MSAVTRNLSVAVLTVAVLMAGSGAAEARQRSGGGAADTAVPVSLKVTVAILRFEGEKQTASLPFVLWVNADGGPGSIQMGSEVPVPTTTMKDGVTTSSYNYRSLGTVISCSARELTGGMYKLDLNIQDNQVFRITDSSRAQTDSSRVQAGGGRPVFQSFRAQHQPILRDGQTVQFAVATDKTNGEVVKLEVTLNVVK